MKIIVASFLIFSFWWLHGMDEKEKHPLKQPKPQQNSLVWPKPPASTRLSRESFPCCQEYCYIHHCCIPLYCLLACVMCSPQSVPGGCCCQEK